MNEFKFCPNCGSQKIEMIKNRKWTCPDCGYDLYFNVAAATGVIIFDSNYNVLFEIRQKDPKKGFLALPGGFVDQDESAENGIIRECKEEIGLDIKNVSFFCSNPNNYEYKGIAYKTCDLFFTAKVESVEDLIRNCRIQKSEVEELCVKKLASMDDLEKLPVAFESSKKTLKKFVQEKING